MKIRAGFVSNSSSSSYLLTVHASLDELFDKILEEYSWSFCSKGDLLVELEKRKSFNEESIKTLKKEIKENKSKKDNLNKVWLKNSKHHLSLTKKDIAAVKKMKDNNPQLVAMCLKLHGIKPVEIRTKYGKVVELSSYTTMHNSFIEGMPDFLKELYLWISFDKVFDYSTKRDGGDN